MTRAAAIGLLIALTLGLQATRAPDREWPFYGHDAGGTRHSPLTQITEERVGDALVAFALPK